MPESRVSRALPASVTVGFGSAAVFCLAAWIAHLPWIDLRSQASGPFILGTWVLAFVVLGRWVPRSIALRAGLIAGTISGLLILIPLGTTLADHATAADGKPVSGAISGQAALRAAGFFIVSLALGTAGVLVGSRLSQAADRPARRWLDVFAVIACAVTFPLIVIGGLVTSTDSGMAFEDWPTSDGASMFLYPLGLMARPDRYLEHSHRLYGSVVGLTVLALMLFTLATERRKAYRITAAALFIAVCLQGIAGGLRVTMDLMPLRIAHGFSGQVFFASLVAFAAALQPSFSNASSLTRDPSLRKLKFLATMALHGSLLQHLLGAMYRHMKYSGSAGVQHILYTHAAVAFLVFFAAFLATVVAGAARPHAGPYAPSLRRWSGAAGAFVAIQFLLGWAAFFALSHDKNALTEPLPITTAITTAHQANGALLLGSLAALWLWSRKLWKAAASTEPTPTTPIA